MGAAVIGKIIVSYVTSQAVTTVGKKIGLSDKQAGILGSIAGIAAGASMGAPTDPGTVDPGAGVDAASGGQGGMLSENLDVTPPSPMAGAGQPGYIPPAVEQTVADQAKTDKPPWYETLWENDTTRNVMVGAASGGAQAFIGASAEEDAYKRKLKEDQARRDRWANFDAQRTPRLQYPDFVRPRSGGMLSEDL